MSWESYLPATLQIGNVYWIIAICVAARMVCASLPPAWRQPWFIQGIVLIVGEVFSAGIIGGTVQSIVYALGTGFICAALATTFYDLMFSVIEQKIRAFLGVPSSGVNMVSIPPSLEKDSPSNSLPPSNPPPKEP